MGDGITVVLGCAHAGEINTLRYVLQHTNGLSIDTVIGGMHLTSAGGERIDKTVEELKRLEIRRLAPMHCTELPATARLWNEFPKKFLACSVGTTISL